MDFLKDNVNNAAVSLSIATFFSIYGYKRRSLSMDGALVAGLVGFCTFFCGVHFGIVLIVFFLSSSKLTKFKSTTKSKLEAEFKQGGQRNYQQVLSNSLPACLATILFYKLYGPEMIPFGPSNSIWYESPTFLQCFLIGFYACCSGDTWSSELGILSRSSPRLILNGSKVPPGTNGGVSSLGLAASIGGGLVIGVSWYLLQVGMSGIPAQFSIMLLASVSGVIGSLFDSLLGATLQYSGWSESTGKVVNSPEPGSKHICGVDLLSNDTVNLLAATLTGLLSGFAGVQYYQ